MYNLQLPHSRHMVIMVMVVMVIMWVMLVMVVMLVVVNMVVRRGKERRGGERTHHVFLAKKNEQHEENFRYHFGSNFSVSTNQI